MQRELLPLACYMGHLLDFRGVDGWGALSQGSFAILQGSLTLLQGSFAVFQVPFCGVAGLFYTAAGLVGGVSSLVVSRYLVLHLSS